MTWGQKNFYADLYGGRGSRYLDLGHLVMLEPIQIHSALEKACGYVYLCSGLCSIFASEAGISNW